MHTHMMEEISNYMKRYEASKDILKEQSKRSYGANKDIKDLSITKYEVRCTLEQEKDEKETKKEEQLKTNTKYLLENRREIEEIIDQQKTRYDDTKKASHKINKEKCRYKERYEANKEIVLERSRARYAANRDAINAQKKAKYAANKDVIKERSRARYAAKKDIIKERKRARYAAKRDNAKALYKIKKDIKDLSTTKNEIRCTLEQEEDENEAKKEEQLKTNTINWLKNKREIEEIADQQKSRYDDKKKVNHKINKKKKRYRTYEANKEIIKERSTQKYRAKIDAIKGENKAKCEANKEAIRKRYKARYAAHADAIKERKRAKYAAQKKNNVRKSKMWTPMEEMALINFVKENEYMKPTAQDFFNRFLENSGIVVADWKIVQSKLCTMRKFYNKTKKWLNTVGTAMANDEEIRDAVRKKCRYYYNVEVIFGSNMQSEILKDQIDEDSITIVKTEYKEFDAMPSLSLDKTCSVFKTLTSNVDNKSVENITDNISTNHCIIKKQKKSRYVGKRNKTKVRYKGNKNINGLSTAEHEINCTLELEKDQKEAEKEKFETNTINQLKNIEEITEQQKSSNGDKNKSSYRRNKEKEQSRRKYEANKEIILERSRARYAAKGDAIKALKRAKYAAERAKDKSKARCEVEKDIENLTTTKHEDKVKSNRKVKIWTPVEQMALINFLKENIQHGMKPTIRAFFNRFLQHSGVNADWKMVYSKYFTMRNSYNNTKKLLNTVEATITDDEKFRNAVRSKCRFYYDYEEIFGSNIQSETLSEQTSNEARTTIIKSENEEFESCYDKTPSSSPDKNFSIFEILSSHTGNEPIKNIPDNISSTYCNDNCLCLIASDLIQSRAEILRLGMEMRNYDTIFRRKTILFLEKQFTVQQTKLKLSEKELENQEQIKMFELEMKEKTLMAELELKYKISI